MKAWFVPEWWIDDLARGLLTGRRTRCEEGAFRLEGLKPGKWRVIVEAPADDGLGSDLRQSIPSVSVQESMVDLGVLEMGEGGTITGVVTDGFGLPVHDTAIWCTPAADTAFTLPAAFDETDRAGQYTLQGLPQGSYRVTPLPWFTAGVRVTVQDGQEARVDLTIGDEKTADEKGFTLVTGGAGETLVETVDPESAMANAGLVEGDVVSTVYFFGVDTTSLHPDLPTALLSSYGGPGMTLVVDREGNRVEIQVE